MDETMPGYERIVGSFEDIPELCKRAKELLTQGKKVVIVAYGDPEA